MAAIDRIFDRLKACKGAGWQPPKQQPDVAPAQQALLIREALTECQRLLPDDENKDELTEGFEQSIFNARQLEEALKSGQIAGANQAMESLRRSCRSCHRAFRD